MQRLHIDRRRGRRSVARSKNSGSAPLQLRLPRRNLIGLDVELLGKLSYRPVALDGGKRHLRLEGRCVVPACSSAHRRSSFAGISVPAVRQKLHLSTCSNLRSRLYAPPFRFAWVDFSTTCVKWPSSSGVSRETDFRSTETGSESGIMTMISARRTLSRNLTGDWASPPTRAVPKTTSA